MWNWTLLHDEKKTFCFGGVMLLEEIGRTGRWRGERLLAAGAGTDCFVRPGIEAVAIAAKQQQKTCQNKIIAVGWLVVAAFQ